MDKKLPPADFLERRFKTFSEQAMIGALSRVVENNPNGVPHARSNATHAVAEIHAIVALRTFYRAIMDGEGHGITLSKWYDLSTALHARPLFGQDELATCKVPARLGEENRDLDREREIAVKILMETVEVARNIL
jgi:hypothetical protein